MLSRILLGILFVLSGGLIIYYSSQLSRMFGSVSWAESALGGTRQLYVLVGFVLMIIGFLVVFGVAEFGGYEDMQGGF